MGIKMKQIMDYMVNEHAHWYDKRTGDGIPIHGKAGEIPSFIREKMGDKL